MKVLGSIEERKQRHIRLSIEEDVQADIGTGFEDIRLIHRSLPEIDLEKPIRILAERDTPFQQVIDALDQCQLGGFERTELKLLSGQVRKRREGDHQ